MNSSNSINDSKTITPLPYPQFYILLCVRLVEPIAFRMVFPFIYFMVKDFGVANNDSEIAYYTGLLTASFSISEGITSILWGSLSDKIGRKPVILMGLLGSAVSLLVFGLSPNYTVALIARAMSGALNGNIGVVRSVVTELTDKTNRPEAFGYLGLMFGFGTIIGPLIGGFLSKPAEEFSSIFGDNQFLKKFPYFLPCALCSVLCLLALIFGAVYLEETLNTKKINSNDLETTPLIKNYKIDHNSSCNQTENPIPPIKQSIPLNTWIAIASQAMQLFFIVMLDETTIFWGAALENQGGMGLKPSEFAIFMIFGGISMLVIQFTIFTRIKERFGILKIYQNIYLFFIVICIWTPCITSLAPFGSPIRKCLLCLTYMARSAVGTFAFNASNVLLANSTPKNSMLGLINGISITMSNISRAIAPTLAGFSFSWSLSNNLDFPFNIKFTFYLVAVVAYLNHLLTKFIKE